MTDYEARQDPAFYHTDGDSQVVWDGDDRFYVVRCGVMKIYYTDKDGVDYTIRLTTDLDELGINTDERLAEMNDKGEPEWVWVNNGWFEIYDDERGEYTDEIYSQLDEAVERAINLGLRTKGLLS